MLGAMYVHAISIGLQSGAGVGGILAIVNNLVPIIGACLRRGSKSGIQLRWQASGATPTHQREMELNRPISASKNGR